MRNQLSKEAYSHEFVNTPELKIKNVSPELLHSFDLLFIDITSLNSLSHNEKADLKAAIRVGLGVIVLPNEEPKNLQWFWPLQFKSNAKDTAHIQLSAHKSYVMPAAPFGPSPDKNIYALMSSNSRELSGYVLQGNGKIGFILLQETYRIKMEGNENDYSKIWSDLISKVARKKISDQISISTPFPVFQYEPLDVGIISQGPASLLSDSTSVSLKEDLAIDDFWHARIWAGQPGWHELKTKNTTLNYFVTPENSWKSLRAANRILDTKRGASHQISENSEVIERKEIPTLIFFLLFLASAGFLWLASKL